MNEEMNNMFDGTGRTIIDKDELRDENLIAVNTIDDDFVSKMVMLCKIGALSNISKVCIALLVPCVIYRWLWQDDGLFFAVNFPNVNQAIFSIIFKIVTVCLPVAILGIVGGALGSSMMAFKEYFTPARTFDNGYHVFDAQFEKFSISSYRNRNSGRTAYVYSVTYKGPDGKTATASADERNADIFKSMNYGDTIRVVTMTKWGYTYSRALIPLSSLHDEYDRL